MMAVHATANVCTAMINKRHWDQTWDKLYRWASTLNEATIKEEASNIWDLKRIAYDKAVGRQWDEVVDRPFYKNATHAVRQRALELAEEMMGNPELILELVAHSKTVRRAI